MRTFTSETADPITICEELMNGAGAVRITGISDGVMIYPCAARKCPMPNNTLYKANAVPINDFLHVIEPHEEMPGKLAKAFHDAVKSETRKPDRPKGARLVIFDKAAAEPAEGKLNKGGTA